MDQQEGAGPGRVPSRRRDFIAMLACPALVWPLVARAQPINKLARIGLLLVGDATANMTGPDPTNRYVHSLLNGLRERGYVYGRDFVTEPRGAEGVPARFPILAAELIGLRPDVIVAAGPTLAALKQLTRTIPVVMSHAEDPLGEGLINSLGHPGGNFTGLSGQFSELAGKRLGLLKELVPRAVNFAVVWDRLSALSLAAAENAAKQLGLNILSFEINDESNIETTFKKVVDARAEAMLVFASGHLFSRAGYVASLAAKSRVPTMYELRAYVDAGGLISYAANLIDIWRRAAAYVDKLLKGATPADLPVEQPTKFELVVNVRAGRELGLEIPPLLLGEADEVIE